MMMRRILFILFVFVCFSLIEGSLAFVNAQSLGLTPAMIDAKVKRGSTYTQAFTLSNGSNARLRVHCSVSDYWYGEHNERLMGRPGTLPRSASLWVQFTPSEIVVEPHASATIKAIITVPLTAAGGYYTAPLFETDAVDSPALAAQLPGTTRATIRVRFQGLILLTTEDATEYNVEIMGGRVAPPTDSSPLEMQLDVRNRGTAHARVRGLFALFDEAGRLMGRGRIDEKRYMPGQRDLFRGTWAGTLPPGHYTAVVTLSYDRAGMEPATLVYEMPFDVH
ncbi:MAG: hypothetical protein AUG51_03010 [Acidobacteria bacterium 13_1_20CM_3_53_8]|nr:MAG: hypothetical protein AUG51_03010 [Acidobacteria bacterium 13_1_20CM_3_53_8]